MVQRSYEWPPRTAIYYYQSESRILSEERIVVMFQCEQEKKHTLRNNIIRYYNRLQYYYNKIE